MNKDDFRGMDFPSVGALVDAEAEVVSKVSKRLNEPGLGRQRKALLNQIRRQFRMFRSVSKARNAVNIKNKSWLRRDRVGEL